MIFRIEFLHNAVQLMMVDLVRHFQSAWLIGFKRGQEGKHLDE